MINGKRGVLLVIISLLFFLLVIKESSGVGILGNQLDVMLEFEPGLEREFSYGVVVTNGEVDQYEAFVVEELAKYMWVEPRYLIFDKTRGGTPSFRAVLKLPNSESELGAGKHCAGVGVTEMFPESVEGEGIKIMARTSAKARVCVRVLYDGKYIEAKLHAPNINENTLFIPEITVSSWGKEDISSVYADVFIQDISGKDVGSIRTNTAGLKSKENVKLSGSFDATGISPGDYKARAVVYYDGEKIEIPEKEFKIGTLYVKILDYTKEIIGGKINKFNIRVESRWNSKIEELSGRIIIGDQDVRTVPISLEQWTEGILEGYVDAGNFDLGEMLVKIIVYYADKTTVLDDVVRIVKDPDEGKFSWFKNINLTITLIILLVVIVEVIWIIGKKVNNSGSKKKKVKKE